MDNEKIIRASQELEGWLIELRRRIHRHPEVANHEVQTQKLICRELGRMGITEIKPYFHTGLAAVIRGGHPGPTLGMRADMDALKITEETGLPYASEISGVMHACGHDGHVAILLGTAKILNEFKNELHGNIKLIFQPAEENGPQGGGAKYMIGEGVLTDEPAVDAMTGLHILPNFPVGCVAGKANAAHAGSDPIYLDIVGRGGHASQPQHLHDPIVAAAMIITALQTVVSRNISPFENAVLGISMIEAGTRHNIVPDRVHMRGTLRTFDPSVRTRIGKRIEEIVTYTAQAMDCEAELDIRWNYGPLVNDPFMYELARGAVSDILGPDSFLEVKEPMTFGEDFSYFAQEVPAVYLWLGGKLEDGKERVLHRSDYNFDEAALVYGVCALSKVAIEYLNQ